MHTRWVWDEITRGCLAMKSPLAQPVGSAQPSEWGIGQLWRRFQRFSVILGWKLFFSREVQEVLDTGIGYLCDPRVKTVLDTS